MSGRDLPVLTDDLLGRIERLPVVDTHEHMTMEADFVRGQYDFTHLMSYVGLDLALAGFPADLWQTGQFAVREGDSVEQKWQRIKPYWAHVRTGVYGRFYRRTLNRFFGVDDLTDQTVHDVSRRIADYQYDGVYDRYLHQQYGIRVSLCVHDHTPMPEPEHFAPVCYLSSYATPCSRDELTQALGQDPPTDFGAYRALLRDRVRTAARNGAVAVKIGMTARRRALDFAAHPTSEVESSYRYLIEQASGDWLDGPTRAALKPFQDAVYWTAFETAGELGLPVQVHSGLEFPQPWDGRPTSLIPSLIRFPETRFAIFHGSYPHMAELTGLAKSFPNVYLDLAWFHILSRRQARAWLAEWLDVLPHNKLFAFGGDVFLFFGICTHLELARENVAAVLAERVADGLCDIDEAEATARALFHDNPWTTFRFSNWEAVKP